MKQTNIQLLLIIGILVVVNFLAAGFFQRFDLTSENRYSLSEVTKYTADSLTAPLFVQIYMEGDFPPNVRRFQDAVRTTLLEMKQYAGGKIDFEFIDPSNNTPLRNELGKLGMNAIPMQVRVSETEAQQKLLFPFAKMIYGKKEQYIDLLKGCTLPNGQVDFIRAEADLEYKLVSPMRNLIKKEQNLVAVMQGHGEQGIENLGEWVTALQSSYQVAKYAMRDSINYGYAISPTIKVLVIPQPTKPFTEREKYEIDQYLMRGGSIFFLLSQEKVDMDLYEKRATMTELHDLNLDDMLMKYGCKVNYDLVQDMNCENTEVFQEGPNGGAFTSKRWLFYPIVRLFPQTPLNRNVDQVLIRNASSIDTFPAPGSKKTVFLTSSEMSRTVPGQQFIELAQLVSNPPPPALFRNKGNRILGLLAEGEFTSLFANRQAPTDSAAPNPPTAKFGARSGLRGKVAVLSDGSFMVGKEFRGKKGYMPYDNKTLLLNTIDYLAGDDALTKIRSKDVEVRTLDREKVTQNKFLIQVLNILLPILLICIFGYVRYVLRKRKNEKVNNHE
ncbi:MAG: gliding motility-associated ABC transporter substrate-binding protein GldG [Bacteroidia bacterium]